MPGIQHRTVLLTSFAAVLAAACAQQSMTRPDPTHPIHGNPIRVPGCSGFTLNSSPLRIEALPEGGDPISIGPGSWIQFAPNAVDAAATYEISYLDVGGRKAGIQIDAVNNAPMTFDEPVLLRISYNFSNCQVRNEAARKSVVRYRDGPGRPFHWMGGTMSADGLFVEVFVSDFSGFAIAI